MATIADHIDAAIDEMFTHLGEDATYWPLAGASVTVKVIPSRPDEIVGFGETDVHSPTTVFDVRVSEAAAPEKDDTIIYDSVTYAVQGVPQRRDPRRRIWTLNTRPVI